MSWLRLSAVCVVLGVSGACGGTHRAPTDASANGIASANQRLAGTWVLQAFQPETSLEPIMQALLASQIGKMTVQFDGQQMIVTGAGLSTQRRYTITQAYQDHVELTSYDEQGIGHNLRGDFVDTRLMFESLTAPWRGHGVIQRAP